MKYSVLLLISLSMIIGASPALAGSGKQLKKDIIGNWTFKKRGGGGHVGWSCEFGVGAKSCAEQLAEDWRKLRDNPRRIAQSIVQMIRQSGSLKEFVRQGKLEFDQIKNADRRRRETAEILEYLDRMERLKREDPDQYCADAYQLTKPFCLERNKAFFEARRKKRREGVSLPLPKAGVGLDDDANLRPGGLY